MISQLAPDRFNGNLGQAILIKEASGCLKATVTRLGRLAAVTVKA